MSALSEIPTGSTPFTRAKCATITKVGVGNTMRSPCSQNARIDSRMADSVEVETHVDAPAQQILDDLALVQHVDLANDIGMIAAEFGYHPRKQPVANRRNG